MCQQPAKSGPPSLALILRRKHRSRDHATLKLHAHGHTHIHRSRHTKNHTCPNSHPHSHSHSHPRSHPRCSDSTQIAGVIAAAYTHANTPMDKSVVGTAAAPEGDDFNVLIIWRYDTAAAATRTRRAARTTWIQGCSSSTRLGTFSRSRLWQRTPIPAPTATSKFKPSIALAQPEWASSRETASGCPSWGSLQWKVSAR